MVPIDTGQMPLWAQIFATLIPIIAAAYAVARGYKGGVNSPTPPPAQDDRVFGQILGVSYGEKYLSLAMTEALRDIKEAIIASTDELRKIRKVIEDHTEATVRRGRTSNRKLQP